MEKEIILRTSLNVRKDRFFTFFTAISTAFIVIIGVLGITQPFLFIMFPFAIIWFFLWMYIGNKQRCEIVFSKDSFSLVQKNKVTIVAFSQIVSITETIERGTFDSTNYYTLLLNEELSSKEIILINPKIQKNISKLFPNVPIKRRVLL